MYEVGRKSSTFFEQMNQKKVFRLISEFGLGSFCSDMGVKIFKIVFSIIELVELWNIKCGKIVFFVNVIFIVFLVIYLMLNY